MFFVNSNSCFRFTREVEKKKKKEYPQFPKDVTRLNVVLED